MVSPNKEPKDCYSQTGKRDKRVTENVLPRKVGDQFAYYAHAGQDHDVNRRVRIEPEEMLEQHRISSVGRVENSYVRQALKSQKQNGDRDNRSAQDHYQRRGIVCPDEEREPEP